MLILITQLELAGAQKVAISQARYFFEQGYPVILCFFYDKAGIKNTLVEKEPFTIMDLEAKKNTGSSLANVFRTFRSIIRLYKLLRKEKIQVIETLTFYSNMIGIITAWIARVPLRISSQRNTLERFPRWFLTLDALLVNSRLTDKMVAVSEQTRRYCIEIEKMNPEKLITIPNGVCLEDYARGQWVKTELENFRETLGVPLHARVITSIARYHSQKGHQYLIEAAPKILQKHPESLFLWVGDGELKGELENKIQSKGLSKSFILLGVRKDIAKILACSDLFVLPSLYEGMPNVLLEAMAASLPVIATAVGGSKELIFDNKNGILIPPADPLALGEAINALLSDKERRLQFGSKACKYVEENFSEKKMHGQYEKMVQELWALKTK